MQAEPAEPQSGSGMAVGTASPRLSVGLCDSCCSRDYSAAVHAEQELLGRLCCTQVVWRRCFGALLRFSASQAHDGRTGVCADICRAPKWLMSFCPL